MKLGQNMCPNDILDEFENGSGWLKNMAARERGSFPFMAIVKPCEHTRGHICCPIIMKLGQNMCSYDILDEFENGPGWLKNMAARGRGSFLHMALVKAC
jgi:hypothetical protein